MSLEQDGPDAPVEERPLPVGDVPCELAEASAAPLDPEAWQRRRVRALFRWAAVALVAVLIGVAGALALDVRSHSGCDGIGQAQGFAEVTAAGWTVECTSTIADAGNAPQGSDILGQADPVRRVITLKETPWAETHTATHEIGHALAAMHPSDSARLWFTERVGASAWEPSSAMDYAQSGAESFAESYAVCSLGERTESSGQYRIASCDDLWHALDLMRADASPANIRTA